MKFKLLLAALLSVVTLTLSTGNAEAAPTKVWWDGTELKKGQIGRVTMLKTGFSIFKLEDGNMVPARYVKKGEVFRVYGIYRDDYTTNYALGANLFAYRSSHRLDGSNEYFQKNLFYETPSKAKLELVRQLNN
ncbi:hypothetical protein [Bacillus sp. NTK034]|uniref:hypothetical protein n=1 Tax=Bacillus sp. NTK034 TaxID=2802176 RepID=UPI001A8C7084|nr:hypothetical protein [Bacillus sp. NTK034]MBN8201445.1 hypothetical protein [Bacillus sp. NTK034]